MDWDNWLKQHTQQLGMEMGIISQVDGDHYLVLHVYSELGFVEVGDRYELTNTYCQAVVEQQQMIAIDHVAKLSDWSLHPCYQALQLESYIATPIWYQQRVFGTLNFSSLSPKKGGFSALDKLKVHELAQEIEASGLTAQGMRTI
ncbi:GAF domain-containing protein [Aliagarivorans marinus]|uniref:GAF domain-containing protein n=1 Tax=Aliagarivorans marinus TaxID=561965 RepID=UPI00041AE44C|nr:GAF domain-containing protein [Aliagarivorans marinus]